MLLLLIACCIFLQEFFDQEAADEPSKSPGDDGAHQNDVLEPKVNVKVTPSYNRLTK